MANPVPNRAPKHTFADMIVERTTGVNSGMLRVSSVKGSEPGKLYMGYTKTAAKRAHRDYLNGKK